jgi:acyl-[acyl-carrier-protein]-phospholipid O-acyltransferase/long-chain-fatty-acid--[acyl-carrier-protein] ligase
MRTAVLGKLLRAASQPGEVVGVLLPNAVATVTTFFGLHAHGRVPAMLNYSAGSQAMASACTTAQLRSVVTSHRFITAAKLDEAVQVLTAQGINILYLEDLASQVTGTDKLRALLSLPFTRQRYRRQTATVRSQDPAVVLFTSGSEGVAKGVILSHANLLANREQIATLIPFSSQDVILNALPVFHSFGLTAGTLLPLLAGMRTFLYPSPLHYRIVPEMAYDINATALFGTNTFLKGYARYAHPYDFYSVRYVFAGAEKLQDDTRLLWMEKFGIRIFEGYGATETSPVMAANTPMNYRAGSPGRLLPGIEVRLEPVPGVVEGGRLHVRGPNVMVGYLLADQPGKIVPPSSMYGPGWYDTGDIVRLDADGYLHIQGRAKRFAKIGGEMISLAAVEELATRTWPAAQHAVISLPDPQKGEQLVLLTTHPAADRKDLLTQARSDGAGELGIPRRLVVTKSLPVLGTGKTDYVAVRALIEQEVTA